jgi:hypothetical protein
MSASYQSTPITVYSDPSVAAATVTQMYQDILGRAPDPGGLAAFTQALESGADPTALAQSMASSPEAQNNAASGQGPSQQQIQSTVSEISSDPDSFTSTAIATGGNPDLANLNLDPTTAANLNALQSTDPNAYYSQLATQIGNQLYSNYTNNQNYDALYNQLQSLQSVAPQAYYQAQAQFLGQQIGWETGQNTSQNAAPVEQQLQQLQSQAQAAGVDPSTIASTANSAAASANQQNQTRIASQSSSGGLGDMIVPLTMTALALGAVFTGGADLALAPELVASADATAAGMGFSSAAEAIQAGALTAEQLGLPAATTAADLGAVSGSASAGFMGTAGSDALGTGAVSSGGFGFNAGAPTVGAASPSGIMATQSAAGLGGSGTGIIEGLVPSSVGMGGTTGAGALAGIAGTEAAAGLGGAALGTGLTAEQLAEYEAAAPAASALPSLSSLAPLIGPLSNLLTGSGTSSGTTGTGTGLTGATKQPTSNLTGSGSGSLNPAVTNLTPGIDIGNPNYTLSDNSVSTNPVDLYSEPVNSAIVNPNLEKTPSFRAGGSTDSEEQSYEHVPEFYSEGGLNNRYVKGRGDGTSDDVPAMLANGEFVIPADVVSALGNGSNDSGSKVLDSFLETIRAHKQKHDAKHLPPDSKGPLAYLLAANKKVKK